MELAIDLTVARDFAIALLIGALVGIEREKKKAQEQDVGLGGIRTFILFAQAGAVSAWLAQQLESPWIVVAGVLSVSAIVLAGYVMQVRVSPAAVGLTTEVAGIVVCLLGAATMLGYPEVAVGLGIVTSATLAYKQPLHGLVGKIGSEDFFAGLRLLIATFIVLPLLPDEAVDEWGALNPKKIWLLVILIAGLSLVGYVAVRALGTHRGTALTGLTGGLVSSTAVSLAFARRSRDESVSVLESEALTVGVLLAWVVMFIRIFVEVAVVNRDLLPQVAGPMGVMCAATAALAGLHYWRGHAQCAAQETPESVPLKNPFSLWSASKFALFFTAILLVVKLVQQYLPESGLLVVAGLAGLTDVDAITLSLADYAHTGDQQIAVTGMVIAALTNTIVKCGLIAVLGGARLRLRILVATGVILASGLVTLLIV
jgi:uncharacterized membrane protein (DUF4010 family)